MKKNIAIINLGLGNIGSVINFIKRLDYEPTIITSGEDLKLFNPTHIIMPGVGAVKQAMQTLIKNNFIEPLEYLVMENNCYFCGICLGMQVLSTSSEEFEFTKCLDWIPGKVIKLDSKGLSLPHMGWNTINIKNQSGIFSIINNKDMYFAHSFAMDCPEKYVAATSNYGSDFVSAVEYKNIYGIQSHPEKSSDIGSMFFKNYLELA